MDYHGFKSAVKRFLRRYAGWDRRPVSFDIDQIFAPLRELERASPRIRAELDALMGRAGCNAATSSRRLRAQAFSKRPRRTAVPPAFRLRVPGMTSTASS
jgi:hypothetical protein